MDLSENSAAYKMREKMCKLWTNFTKFGNPTSDFSWKPMEVIDDLNYFILDDTDVCMEKNINKVRMDFWRRLLLKSKL